MKFSGSGNENGEERQAANLAAKITGGTTGGKFSGGKFPAGKFIAGKGNFRREQDYSEPNLIRTSGLDAKCIRKNMTLANTPVKLHVEKDPMTLTENWLEKEIRNERRLVKFSFVRFTPTDFGVDFVPIDKDEYSPDQPIISCIYWKEKDLYAVTSVDIILILEYLVRENFSIEEKNRVRRNLQSLKPFTIVRSNKEFERFFNVLMHMEDPRPRNIEKDLKVFKWSDLFNAFNKVLSKYSANVELAGLENIKKNGGEAANHATKTDDDFSDGKTYQVSSSNLGSESSNISVSRNLGNDTKIMKKLNPLSEASSRTFMPNERLKDIKRKNSQILHQNSINRSQKIYEHALRPDSSLISASQKSEAAAVKPELMKRFADSLDTTDEEKNKTDETESADFSETPPEDNSKGDSPSSVERIDEAMSVGSAGDIAQSGSHSSLGTYLSLNDEAASNVFSNGWPDTHYSTNNTSRGSVDTAVMKKKNKSKTKREKKKLKQKKEEDMDNFTQDQRSRIFGRKSETSAVTEARDLPYYEYPSSSQLYRSKPNRETSASTLPDKSNSNIKLPSLEASLRNSPADIRNRPIKLPAISQNSYSKRFPGTSITGPLPGPSEIESNIQVFKKSQLHDESNDYGLAWRLHVPPISFDNGENSTYPPINFKSTKKSQHQHEGRGRN